MLLPFSDQPRLPHLQTNAHPQTNSRGPQPPSLTVMLSGLARLDRVSRGAPIPPKNKRKLGRAVSIRDGDAVMHDEVIRSAALHIYTRSANQ